MGKEKKKRTNGSVYGQYPLIVRGFLAILLANWSLQRHGLGFGYLVQLLTMRVKSLVTIVVGYLLAC